MKASKRRVIELVTLFRSSICMKEELDKRLLILGREAPQDNGSHFGATSFGNCSQGRAPEGASCSEVISNLREKVFKSL